MDKENYCSNYIQNHTYFIYETALAKKKKKKKSKEKKVESWRACWGWESFQKTSSEKAVLRKVTTQLKHE